MTTEHPLRFYLIDLIGDCEELPEIVPDNARCGRGNEVFQSVALDSCSSSHSTTSRWDSMPPGRSRDSSSRSMDAYGLRCPAREVRRPSISAAAAADRCSLPLKLPTRTDSFGEMGMMSLSGGIVGHNKRICKQGSPQQQRESHTRKTPLTFPSLPSRDVHDILNEATAMLEPDEVRSG